MSESVFCQLCTEARYAMNSRSILLMYQAYGATKMAWKLGAISNDEFFELNETLVRNGINNPRSYDRAR